MPTLYSRCMRPRSSRIARAACSRAGLTAAFAAAGAMFVSGCGKPAPFALQDRKPRSDRVAPFDPPKTYPEWTADAANHIKPAAELQPEPRVRPEDPLHYFTNKPLVPIQQPGGYQPEELPRVSVWYTDNNGFEWKRAGYFGQSQSTFWLETRGDGDYGVRFAGPGQEPAKMAPAEPVRVYHVDTTVPEVTMMVDPNHAWYQPGQTIQISWKASDYHLAEQPVEVSMANDFSSDRPVWTVIQKDLEAEGRLTHTLAMDSAGRGITFRVAARDRANNLGIAYSHLIQVVAEQASATPDAQCEPIMKPIHSSPPATPSYQPYSQPRQQEGVIMEPISSTTTHDETTKIAGGAATTTSSPPTITGEAPATVTTVTTFGQVTGSAATAPPSRATSTPRINTPTAATPAGSPKPAPPGWTPLDTGVEIIDLTPDFAPNNTATPAAAVPSRPTPSAYSTPPSLSDAPVGSPLPPAARFSGSAVRDPQFAQPVEAGTPADTPRTSTLPDLDILFQTVVRPAADGTHQPATAAPLTLTPDPPSQTARRIGIHDVSPPVIGRSTVREHMPPSAAVTPAPPSVQASGSAETIILSPDDPAPSAPSSATPGVRSGSTSPGPATETQRLNSSTATPFGGPSPPTTPTPAASYKPAPSGATGPGASGAWPAMKSLVPELPGAQGASLPSASPRPWESLGGGGSRPPATVWRLPQAEVIGAPPSVPQTPAAPTTQPREPAESTKN